MNEWIDVPFTNGVYSAGSKVFSTFDISSYYYSESIMYLDVIRNRLRLLGQVYL